MSKVVRHKPRCELAGLGRELSQSTFETLLHALRIFRSQFGRMELRQKLGEQHQIVMATENFRQLLEGRVLASQSLRAEVLQEFEVVQRQLGELAQLMT